MEWTLAFRVSRPITIQSCEDALSGFVGGPVSTATAAFIGNPRDGFFRSVTITAPWPERGMTLVLRLGQEAWVGGDDPDATTDLQELRMDAPAASFEIKLAAWHELREAFATLGWADDTLVSWPSPIVDDAEAAGETAVAARLRADITAALVARATRPDHFEVGLRSPRADDLEAVLEAYVEPERIVLMTLVDCGLRRLPKAFARFPNLEVVHLDSNPIEARAVRGVSRSRVYMLSMSDCLVSTIERADLAGLPALRNLSVGRGPLHALDPGLIEVCPALTHVDIGGTPLAGDDARVNALRARWTNVTLA